MRLWQLKMDKENNKVGLPITWTQCTLKDVGEIIAGGTPSTNEPSYWGDEVYWITPADLSGYKFMFISKGRKSISKKGLQNSSARLIPKGSVLFSSRAPIGYVAIASNELATNQGFKNIVPYSGIDSKFLYYYLIANKHIAEENASGTTFKEISASKFADLPLVLAPSNEQARIVDKLDALLSELEKGKEQLQTSLEQLKVYRQSILKYAFEGKLSEEWRRKQKKLKTPDELVAEIKAYRKEQYEKQLKEYKAGKIKVKPKEPKEFSLPTKSELSDKPELPEGWFYIFLKDISEVVGRVNIKEKKPTESFLYLDIGGINNNKNIIESHKEYKWKDAPSRAQQIVEVNDILFSTVRTYMKNIAMVEDEKFSNQVASSGFTVVRALKGIINSNFLFKQLLSDAFIQPLNDLQTGSSYPAVRDTDVFIL
jgi:type I restriction enzyme S subunit